MAETMRELPLWLRMTKKSVLGKWRMTPSVVLDKTRPSCAPWSEMGPVATGVFRSDGVDATVARVDFDNSHW